MVVVVATVVVRLGFGGSFGHGGVGYNGGLVGIIGVGGNTVTRLLPEVVGQRFGSGGGRRVLIGGRVGRVRIMGGSVYTGVKPP